MADMYANIIRKDEKKTKKKDWRLYFAVAAAVAGLAVLGIFVAQPLICRFVLYPRFVSAVSDSTLYAYENDCLRADMGGESVHVSGDNAYSFLKSLTVGPPDKLVFGSMDEEPDLKLDYGDGSALSLWAVPAKDSEAPKAMRVLYEGKDHSRISFYTDSISVERLSRWAKPDREGNEEWK